LIDWNPLSLTGTIPADTLSVEIEMVIGRTDGVSSDGLIDNFSLVLDNSPVPSPTAAGMIVPLAVGLLRRRNVDSRGKRFTN